MRYTVALTVRFTEEMLEELRKVAEREQRSAGAVIRIAVKEKMERDGEEGHY